MEPAKLPKTDSLPAEFYKVFWKDVSPFVIRCLNKSHQKGELALTQRRGIISLIPERQGTTRTETLETYNFIKL